MRIRQGAMAGAVAVTPAKWVVTFAMGATLFASGWCDAQTAVDIGTVVTLPGIHASAGAPGCAEANGARGAALSFDCLNRAVAPTGAPATLLPADADVRHRPTNQLGLYNAAALGHRMGPNLGTSVQPYRPRTTYPTPLAPSH